LSSLQKAIAQLMEDRVREPRSTEVSVLSRFLSRLRERSDTEHHALLEAFARELFGRDLPILQDATDLEPFVSQTIASFHFLRTRGNTPCVVRAFASRGSASGEKVVVIETVLDDRPFIVDTICETVRTEGGEVCQLLHPMLGVTRGTDGTLEAVGHPDPHSPRESFVHVEVTGLEDPQELQRILTERLDELRVVTDDYPEMRARVAEVAEGLRDSSSDENEGTEIGRLLVWLGDKNFVYIGYAAASVGDSIQEAQFSCREETCLGILRNPRNATLVTRAVPDGEILTVSTLDTPSPIHRSAPMTDLAVRVRNASGTGFTEHHLIGLFTSKAYYDPASEIPVLRRHLEALFALEGVVTDSHDQKEIYSLFNSLPKEELFATALSDLHKVIRAIRVSPTAFGVRVLVHGDTARRGLFLVVILPRARFSTEFSDRATEILRDRLNGKILYQHLAIDERPQARLHLYCAADLEAIGRFQPGEVEPQIASLLRTWEDELRLELESQYSTARAHDLIEKFRNVFPQAYKAETEVSQATRDIHCLEQLIKTANPQIELTAPTFATSPPLSVLRLYLSGAPLILSDFVPVLENLGLRVFGEDVTELQLANHVHARIHAFFVQPTRQPEVDPAASADRLVAAIHAIRSGLAANDRLNVLILPTSLDWQQVDVLRTYVQHVQQTGFATRATLLDALTHHPDSAAALFRLFSAKFDPQAPIKNPAQRESGPVAEAQTAFLSSLDNVDVLLHDQILRVVGKTIDATVRTNFYRKSDDPDGGAIVVKIIGSELAHSKSPRPAFEAYVHSPYVEGIHLRAGLVARGGIRMSDRPDDFRAEVLGLMHTQVAKNAVIVPVGAKGGFVVQAAGSDIGGEGAARAYRIFVAGLLSITDNIEHGRVVPPAGQIIYDGPDPYLVIAADKGTATYSDVANAIAARHNFWLGDAFASGGQQGYDHKQLGITARGAWESVRQHFREMGRDADREPLDVISIGDMSGDVFGNGMLSTRTLRLRAAFNHRHIFLDPNPEPQSSYWERERLFRLPRSTWEDYDTARISTGGGVFRRSAKTIELSAEARQMLGIETPIPSGEEVVQAILRMQADLLWNGGVGTYVKASDESNESVADPANDRVRIDANELRASVVGEGGNLGFTQRARIQFALQGGHIHTDAIDNSGGVDCSDHEVNLKIAMQPLVESRRLSREQRNELLTDLANEVCEAVLAHNRRQALALSLDEARSRTDLAAFRDLMTYLESDAGMDRHLENLPTREALRDRRGTFLGLTRPELAVLLAATKLHLQQSVLASGLCDDPSAEPYLLSYFPSMIRQRYPDAARKHPLRAEITAVELTNRLVDSMGMTFFTRIARDTGRETVELVNAWTAAMAIGSVEDLLSELDNQRSALSAEAEQGCCFAIERSVARATKWLVETNSSDASPADVIDRFRMPVERLLSSWTDLLTEDIANRRAEEVGRLTDLGLTAATAERVAQLESLSEALELTYIAGELDYASTTVARAYFQAALVIDLDWVRSVLPSVVAGEGRWEQRAKEALSEGLLYARRQLTMNVLSYHMDSQPVDECVRAYATESATQLQRVQGLIADLKAAPQPGLPAMLVVMRELGRLVRPASPPAVGPQSARE
jgi:glutamate dehydrogenase